MSGFCCSTGGLIDVDCAGLAVGSRVRIYMELPSPLVASAVLYLIPLVSMVLGFIAGSAIGSRLSGRPRGELPGLVGAALAVVAAFAIIAVVERRRANSRPSLRVEHIDS